MSAELANTGGLPWKAVLCLVRGATSVPTELHLVPRSVWCVIVSYQCSACFQLLPRVCFIALVGSNVQHTESTPGYNSLAELIKFMCVSELLGDLYGMTKMGDDRQSTLSIYSMLMIFMMVGLWYCNQSIPMITSSGPMSVTVKIVRSSWSPIFMFKMATSSIDPLRFRVPSML